MNLLFTYHWVERGHIDLFQWHHNWHGEMKRFVLEPARNPPLYKAQGTQSGRPPFSFLQALQHSKDPHSLKTGPLWYLRCQEWSPEALVEDIDSYKDRGDACLVVSQKSQSRLDE